MRIAAVSHIEIHTGTKDSHKSQETLMKTGKDASRSGLYVSECCLKVVALVKGQMFPRCPRCWALTGWDSVKPPLRISPSDREDDQFIPEGIS
jgi:hypothetical protein